MRRKRALVYDLTTLTVDDPASVKGKQITAVSSQLQLIRIAAHARCRSARCKDHFMSALHNMDNAALCFRRDLLLGICQCSVNIQYQYFCFHFVSSVFFFVIPLSSARYHIIFAICQLFKLYTFYDCLSKSARKSHFISFPAKRRMLSYCYIYSQKQEV
jgi:hypothetical protein